MLVQLRGVLIPLLLNRYPPKACVDRKIMVFSEPKETIYEGGIRGVWILQNHTEILIKTAQNNIRKPQTALKLPENFKILQTTWYCKTAILRLKKKISAKLHQKSSKTASLQTLTPPSSHIYMYIGQLMSMLLSLNSWQLLYLFFIIHVTTLPPTTTPFTRFLPKQRPDSGRLTYTGGLCMDCLNAVICHFSLYNSATMHLLCFLVKVCGCPGACSLRAGSLSFLLWNFWTALFISCDLQHPRKLVITKLENAIP